MKTIKDYITKPSQAVRSMVAGLRKQSTRSDFKIDMGTYGRVKRGICFGCAATCAVQEMTGVNFDKVTLLRRSTATGIHPLAFKDFENNINDLRVGYPRFLVNYVLSFKGENVNIDLVRELSNFALPVLSSGNWKANIHHYEAYAEWLEKKGY